MLLVQLLRILPSTSIYQNLLFYDDKRIANHTNGHQFYKGRKCKKKTHSIDTRIHWIPIQINYLKWAQSKVKSSSLHWSWHWRSMSCRVWIMNHVTGAKVEPIVLRSIYWICGSVHFRLDSLCTRREKCWKLEESHYCVVENKENTFAHFGFAKNLDALDLWVYFIRSIRLYAVLPAVFVLSCSFAAFEFFPPTSLFISLTFSYLLSASLVLSLSFLRSRSFALYIPFAKKNHQTPISWHIDLVPQPNEVATIKQNQLWEVEFWSDMRQTNFIATSCILS